MHQDLLRKCGEITVQTTGKRLSHLLEFHALDYVRSPGMYPKRFKMNILELTQETCCFSDIVNSMRISLLEPASAIYLVAVCDVRCVSHIHRPLIALGTLIRRGTDITAPFLRCCRGEIYSGLMTLRGKIPIYTRFATISKEPSLF